MYGRNPVRELLRAGRRETFELYATEQVVAGADWIGDHPVTVTTRDRLAGLVGTGDHQGIVARVAPFPYAELADVLVADGPLVCLDGAHDPRNLGAIVRVAEGAGAAGLIIPARGGPGVTQVVAKASAGAIEHLPIVRAGSVLAAVHDVRQTGRLVFGAHPDGAVDYRDADWTTNSLVVMGAEGEGLRPRVRSACDVLMRIPMRGQVASLNISVACGLLLYEAIRNTQ